MGNEKPSDFWTISGRVTNAVTGGGVAQFQVTPGEEFFPSEIRFEEFRRTQGVDGTYAVSISKRVSMPAIKVEANGYLPSLVFSPQENRSDFDLALQPGSGPSGKVLSSNGQPAANVTVALVCSGHYYQITAEGLLLSKEQAHLLSKTDRMRRRQQRSMIATTDAAGQFSFSPELKMEWIVASSLAGFAVVSLDEFASRPELILQPWGRIKGVLKWPSGPAANENLDLAFTRFKANPRWNFDIGNRVTTDPEGRFEFARVPPGELQLTYRVKMDERKWRSVPLLPPITLGRGQTLELPIEAAQRKTFENFIPRQPEPALRTGLPVTGTVLIPGGQPAAGTDVGLVVSKMYLGLLKGALDTGGRDPIIKTRTDANGQFELPGFQNVRGVVAVSDEGFARVPPDPDGKPLTLVLQPWGEISGIVRIGDRLGANELVELQSSETFDEPRLFRYQSLQARTDSRGHFALTYVPPGEHYLVRQIPDGENSWSSSPPTMVDVKSGEVTCVTLGGTGRRVVGKLVPKTAQAAVDWRDVKVHMMTVQYAAPRELQTPEERRAWNESAPGRAARRKMRYYDARLMTDGAFIFEDVDPEDYSLTVFREKRTQVDRGLQIMQMMMGGKNVSVPGATSPDSASQFDVGSVEVKLPAEFPTLPA